MLIEFRREIKVVHIHHTQNVVHLELVLRVSQLHRVGSRGRGTRLLMVAMCPQ